MRQVPRRVVNDYRSPLLDRLGAVPADAPDVGVAAHYGDPIREQRHLAAGAGLVDLSHHDVVRIAGPDRLSWLHNLTTQRLDKLLPGEGTEALVLSPQGHVEHHLLLVDDGAATWAHVEPGAGGSLVEFLNSMRFMGAGHSLKVAMIGRNLKTWTKYSGFDPEASSNGDFNFRIDGFRYPSYRQFTGQIEIGF